MGGWNRLDNEIARQSTNWWPNLTVKNALNGFTSYLNDLNELNDWKCLNNTLNANSLQLEKSCKMPFWEIVLSELKLEFPEDNVF